MSTGDANYIRNLNRELLLETILRTESISRSELSRSTGLNKATVSVQVQSLIEDKIIRETRIETLQTPGRRPTLLEMNGDYGFSIGIDLDYKKARIVFINLKGKPFYTKVLPCKDENIDTIVSEVKSHLSPLIKQTESTLPFFKLRGICLGIHGIINDREIIEFTPKQKWTDVDLKDGLEKELNVPVHIENNANLSSYAEQVYSENTSNLFCLTLYSGIGLGIIYNHKIYRGFQGFAGEIGHMVIEPNGKQCDCGNKGCWELYASENSLKETLLSLGLGENFNEIIKSVNAEETITTYIEYLSYGLNNIINIFNPQRVIFNGSLINQNPDFIERLESSLRSKIIDYESIGTSKIGEFACALGGAAFVLKTDLGVNTLNFTELHYLKEINSIKHS
ncbi:ROK family transcriptional regulator [Salimicrobium halophilum]|uniref:Sugar kinase of the NBD/HSP70 family, may contain an N-terminal HTH domain n=1 Tax=Salimicrobium halophilum TaxID=86666 RepID=A0A1G8T7B7_9BACI|nr:ROK family transcriptional regulator [Salimicrobium halophilum]SDJ37442.1 Sugar kinase of the NBD/HSP70 family, may contain an N-terminal HTH domain [Salimicrobium halophilum]